MSSRTPTRVRYSLEEFSNNGSRLRGNRDGWGIALARDRDAFIVKEPEPAKDSVWVRFVADHGFESTMAIAHVRHATRGLHTLENTHPFRRALGRHTHLFAHNGTLMNIEQAVDYESLTFFPVGDTDSELAFCTLLSRLRPHYGRDKDPTVETRFEVFSGFCKQMAELGPSNFLYYDGEILFAHAHKRIYEEAGELVGPKAPGLQMKECWAGEQQDKIRAPGLKVDLPNHHTILLASVPLDDQGWEALSEGTILALRRGELIRRN